MHMAKIAITTENTASKLRRYANPRTLDYMLEQNKEFQDFLSVSFISLGRIVGGSNPIFTHNLERLWKGEAFLLPPFKKSSRKAYNGHICRPTKAAAVFQTPFD